MTSPSRLQAPSGSMRDAVIIAGTIVFMAVLYFALRSPTRPADTNAREAGTHRTAEPPSMAAAMDQMAALPHDSDSLVAMGNALMDAGNIPVAAECYRRALEVKDSADVRVDYGACLHSMGLPGRALEEFQTVLGRDPDHGIATYNVAIVYYNLEEADSARVYLERFLSLKPDPRAAASARSLLDELTP